MEEESRMTFLSFSLWNCKDEIAFILVKGKSKSGCGEWILSVYIEPKVLFC